MFKPENNDLTATAVKSLAGRQQDLIATVTNYATQRAAQADYKVFKQGIYSMLVSDEKFGVDIYMDKHAFTYEDFKYIMQYKTTEYRGYYDRLQRSIDELTR